MPLKVGKSEKLMIFIKKFLSSFLQILMFFDRKLQHKIKFSTKSKRKSKKPSITHSQKKSFCKKWQWISSTVNRSGHQDGGYFRDSSVTRNVSTREARWKCEKKFVSKIAKSGILEFCWLYLSAKCIKKTSWFMLYSGIHYVSPAGDFCPKLHVLNL